MSRYFEKGREPVSSYTHFWGALASALGTLALAARSLHTGAGGAVLAGVSDAPIGVDIERLRPVSPAALRRLAPGVEERDFFPCWVRREARAKLDGAHMDALLRAETPLGKGEFYYPLDTFPGYAAGAATNHPEPPGPVSLYTLDELTRKTVFTGDVQG